MQIITVWWHPDYALFESKTKLSKGFLLYAVFNFLSYRDLNKSDGSLEFGRWRIPLHNCVAELCPAIWCTSTWTKASHLTCRICRERCSVVSVLSVIFPSHSFIWLLPFHAGVVLWFVSEIYLFTSCSGPVPLPSTVWSSLFGRCFLLCCSVSGCLIRNG